MIKHISTVKCFQHIHTIFHQEKTNCNQQQFQQFMLICFGIHAHIYMSEKHEKKLVINPILKLKE